MMCLFLMGCGTIKKQWVEFAPDRDKDYLEATTTPALTMPPDITMNKSYLSNPYPMPQGALPKAGATPVDIFPPDLKRTAEQDNDDEESNDDDDTTDAS
jgi:uncharacterized lipoprotein